MSATFIFSFLPLLDAAFDGHLFLGLLSLEAWIAVVWCQVGTEFDEKVIVVKLALVVHCAQGQWMFALAANAKAFIKPLGTERHAQSLLQLSQVCKVLFKASILALQGIMELHGILQLHVLVSFP